MPAKDVMPTEDNYRTAAGTLRGRGEGPAAKLVDAV